MFSRKVGPLSVGAWAVLVGGGGIVAYMFANRSTTTTRTVVDQVPVPVGAIAAPDGAPLVMSPIIRVNTQGIDDLTAALTGNTGATKELTGATKASANLVAKNTSALSGNTTAVKSNTTAVKSNTTTVKANTTAVKAAPKPAPLKKPGKVALTLAATYKNGADFAWKIATTTDGIQFQTSWLKSFLIIGHNYRDKESPTRPRNQKAGTQYYARARAYNSAGYGDWSNVVSYKTKK